MLLVLIMVVAVIGDVQVAAVVAWHECRVVGLVQALLMLCRLLVEV